MRTIIDLPDAQLDVLDQPASQEAISRAELIRRAVADYLQRQVMTAESDGFGVWRRYREEGVAYQQRLRGEWGAS